MAYTPYATPTVNVKINLPADLYLRATIERALPTGGPLIERRANPAGVQAWYPDAKHAIVVGELARRRMPSPDHGAQWLRVTGWYNTQGYFDYREPVSSPGKTDNNWALSGAADVQVWQNRPFVPFDGIYAGATYQYAPPAANLYSQYFELRLYSFGLIPHREFDMISLNANHTRFSGPARRYLESLPADPTGAQPMIGVPTYETSTSNT